jgi:CheY-like chemotaxis protein
VVDDEGFARLFALQILVDLGFLVLEAADAAEAIEMLHDNQDVMLVFTDISMPGAMDGAALAAEVRRARPHVALVVTSGHAPPAMAMFGETCRFLAKPYTATALIDAINAVTDARLEANPAMVHCVALGKA